MPARFCYAFAKREKETSMIIVVAALSFDTQAARDHAVSLIADVQLATRVEEAGCRDYCFAPDPSVATRIQVYELWDDSDSLTAHFKHPNYHKMVELLGSAGIKESINQAYLVERGESVYGPNGQMKDAFFTD
jgi:quinol monooxygenase YgiN